MNNDYHKTLLATAIAVLIAGPALAASDMAESSPDETKSKPAQTQKADRSDSGWQKVDGAARAAASNNALYNHTPDELSGMEVVGVDGKSLGKIKTVVMARNLADVHAVISTGGMMGIGAHEVLVPVSELKLVKNDRIQANLPKETIAESTGFNAEHYGVLEANRRIGDFSAFKPAMSAAKQATAAAEAATERKAVAAAKARAAAQEQSMKQAKPVEMNSGSLHGRTPENLHGMEVVGMNCQSLGKVNSVVTSKNPNQAHAVVASGGFMGLGERKITVPLSDLTAVGEKQLQANFNQDSVETRPEYKSGEYGPLATDRPISEFLAFESNSNR